MKILVTHINPHLDDISAIWLYKRFHPEFKSAKLDFIDASRDAALKQKDQSKVYIGTGGGQFDEHKGDLEDCAASLVWKEIKKKGLAPKDKIELKAYEEFVKWNLLVDQGKFPQITFFEFSVPAFIRPKDNQKKSSVEAVNLGEEIFGRILLVLKRKQQSIRDWQKRVEFKSHFGRSYAVVSSTVDRDFCKEQGGDLFLIYHPKYKSVQFFTPSHKIDLSPIYQKVHELEPDASWYLHQSHHIILCGASAQPTFKPSSLTFEELIKLVKSL